MRYFLIAILAVLLTVSIYIPLSNTNKVEQTVQSIEAYTPYDIMYFNRTNNGAYNGKLVFTYNHLELHHGTSTQFFYFKKIEYNDLEQTYKFWTTHNNTTIIFDPTMKTLIIGDDSYYICSTIKSHW